MDGGGDQPLSRTGLAEDKDRCVRRSDLLRSIESRMIISSRRSISAGGRFRYPARVENAIQIVLTHGKSGRMVKYGHTIGIFRKWRVMKERSGFCIGENL